MVNRREIVSKAIQECLTELYKWAQPSIDFNTISKLLENKATRGFVDNEQDSLYKRHYISDANLKYIIKCYKEAYKIGSDFQEYINLLIKYITDSKSVKDVYIPGNDERPGYRSYESIKTLQEITKDSDKVLELIDTCKRFYNIDVENNQFSWAIYLGCSPSSNKEEVEKYWHEHGYPYFKIKDFNIDEVLYSEDVTVDEFIRTLTLC